jgi:hypothetical protein
MHKFVAFLVASALSCSAFAADAEKQPAAGPNAGAEAKGDANSGASTASDNAVSEKRDDSQGRAKDSHQSNPKPGKTAKRKKDDAGAGATTGTSR